MIKRALVTVVAAAGLALTASAPAFAAQPYPINFKNFPLGSYASVSGTTVSGGAVTLASAGLASFPYTDPFADYSGDGADGSGAYRSGSWTSPDTPLSFGFNELVASWNANTPDGTWIQVEMQPKMLDGHWAKWYILGRWSSSDGDFHRTSVGGQGNADGFVSIDTFFAKDHVAVAYRLRVTLFRRDGSRAAPTLTRLSAVAMNLTNQKNTFPSETAVGNVDLHLPQYSQEIHHGDFPQYDNGGEAWCSPTSTSMVVRYWGLSYQPTPLEY